jgi:hypothetical protein
MRLAHIINPVKASPSSTLFEIQNITFSSIRVAKNFAESHSKDFHIDLFTTQYAEDHEIIPADFAKRKDLERSILDCATFTVPRKLPFLTDILAQLSDLSNADYYIYTNIDIALMPHFYLAIRSYVEEGYCSFIVNRRTISENNINTLNLVTMYSEIGKKHQGYDCFVFKREILDSLILKKIVVGIPKVGLAFFVNLFCRSASFKVFANQHLTFHIGDDKAWKSEDYADYWKYNNEQFKQILSELPNKLVEQALDYHNAILVTNGFLVNFRHNDEKLVTKVARVISGFLDKKKGSSE